MQIKEVGKNKYRKQSVLKENEDLVLSIGIAIVSVAVFIMVFVIANYK